jgi:ribosomal protein S14
LQKTPAQSQCTRSGTAHGNARSLFFSRDIRAIRQLAPDREILREASDDTRLVVSEPMGDLPGAWVEMPNASYGMVSKAGDRLLSFTPKPPGAR